MSVDMFERRFRIEIEKLPPFVPNDARDPVVWDADFPAWRALFSSLCLYGHSTGYRLPSYEQFFRYCETAYTKQHPDRDRFLPLFQDRLAGVQQRISAWYESGMAETHLYVCLVESIEDKSKLGLVLYDPRADWKFKADVIIIMRGKPIRVSAFFGDAMDRPSTEARRDVIERRRKQNTMESAHWGNVQLAAMTTLEISRTATDFQAVNGLQLFFPEPPSTPCCPRSQQRHRANEDTGKQLSRYAARTCCLYNFVPLQHGFEILLDHLIRVLGLFVPVHSVLWSVARGGLPAHE